MTVLINRHSACHIRPTGYPVNPYLLLQITVFLPHVALPRGHLPGEGEGAGGGAGGPRTQPQNHRGHQAHEGKETASLINYQYGA